MATKKNSTKKDEKKESKEQAKKAETQSKKNKEEQPKKEKEVESKESFFRTHKKKILVISIVSFLILIIAGVNIVLAVAGVKSFVASTFFDTPVISELFEDDEDEELSATIPRKLDGIIVDREEANNVPACVMIENAAFGGVRPQSGLSKALVMYEVIVEGGITRFMAVFAGEQSDTVGPVRSARDTYLEFASEMDCAYYHAGGSFTAMQALQRFSMRDVDGLREPSFFWRQSGKAAPHNFFTSTSKLEDAIRAHGWDQEEPPDFESWLFVDEIEQPEQAEVSNEESEGELTEEAVDQEQDVVSTRVYIGFGGSYDVEFNYDVDELYYTRKNGGIDHIDAVTGKVLTTRNIIVQHVGAGIPIEGKGRINWPVTGEGTVDVIREGVRTTGTWEKKDRESRTVFLDEDGDEIPLVRGNTWVEIVPEHITVEF